MVKPTVDSVLRVLDDAAADFDFLILDNGYTYPVDVRLSAYGDGTRWAIAMEDMNVSNRSLEFSNYLNCFGNCLKAQQSNKDFVSATAYKTWRANHRFDEWLNLGRVGSAPSAPLMLHDARLEQGEAEDIVTCGLEVNPKAKELTIRGHLVPIPRSQRLYRSRGITLERHPTLLLQEVMRYLAPDQRSRLVATTSELRRVVPEGLPLQLRLNEWRHPDLAGDEMPGQTETFPMIASVLVNCAPSKYRPSEAPNTHWSNWPEAGGC